MILKIRIPMIFGFNTDVKHGDTMYHVQSEARESELLLQTQVFVRGRCIGKRATSYADKRQRPASPTSRKSRSCATSTAWFSTPSAKANWTTSSTSPRPRDSGRRSKNSMCNGSMPIRFTPTAI